MTDSSIGERCNKCNKKRGLPTDDKLPCEDDRSTSSRQRLETSPTGSPDYGTEQQSDEQDMYLGTQLRERKDTSSSCSIKIDWVSTRTAQVVMSSSTDTPASASTPALLISGRGFLCCLQGSLKIHGYTLSNSKNKQQQTRRIAFDCPFSWSHWLTITRSDLMNENGDVENEVRLQIDTMTLQPRENESVASLSLSPGKQKQKESPASFTLNVLDDHNNQRNYRPTIMPAVWEQTVSEIFLSYQLHSRFIEEQFTEHPSSTILNVENERRSATMDRKQLFCPFVVAICGAKGVGKSTFLRFLLHRFLSSGCDDENQSVSVSVLDADMGQPEFNPPGMVTLTRNITEPILSPPHMHMVAGTSPSPFSPISSATGAVKPNGQIKYHQQSYFLATTSSSQTDTSAYMQSIERLVQDFISLSTRETARSLSHVLLVNLDGWVKGIGGELLQALLQQSIQPTHVVQIQGTSASQQFELDGTSLTNRNGKKTSIYLIPSYSHYYNLTDVDESVIAVVGSNPMALPAVPIEESNAVQQKMPAPSVLPASVLRTLRFSTYFLKNDLSIWERIAINLNKCGPERSYINDSEFEIAKRLAAMAPYVVPIEAVELVDPCRCNSSLGDPFELYPWNASVIGLCCRKTDDDATPWFLLPCLGLGLIRSIDVRQRLLYILTPVDPQSLADVNVLVRSQQMGLPMEMTFRGVDAECFPYMEMKTSRVEGIVPLGTDPIKSRNSIGRRKFRLNNDNGG
ncbi:hypothetical protein ACA910_000793 [Epithemia clementina (nom. ined.)]